MEDRRGSHHTHRVSNEKENIGKRTESTSIFGYLVGD